MAKEMRINALRYECGHLVAAEDIPDKIAIFNPALILPGKCPICQRRDKEALKQVKEEMQSSP